MNWRAYLAGLICPEAFRVIEALDEVMLDLLHKNGILDATLAGMERGISELRSTLRNHNEVHVVLGIDHDGEAHPWEAHFSKAAAEQRKIELDNAAELAFKRRIHQIEQMYQQIRNKELPDAPTIPWEDRMALFSLNGLGEYVGRVRFFVLSMPVGSPNKGKIIELLQAKETDEEAAGT